jgi:hypothetical protein
MSSIEEVTLTPEERQEAAFRAFKPQECDLCLIHFADLPGLVEACASVGISRGKSTGTMLKNFMWDYHIKGHKGGPARPRKREKSEDG